MAIEPLSALGATSIDEFLKHYWQKQPLFIPQAIPDFSSPITADELAGLSLEEDVVSRLAIQDQITKNWSLEHGPFPEDRFANLPETDWTLLIQHADLLDLEVNDILHWFRFIPNWRLDDIMISYAPDNGGVGPHFDYYDVFLLQAEGKRRWRIGQQCDDFSTLVADQPMKVLQHFDTQEEYICEPGDLIYIPAGCAHWGEAIGESITYSIGFRAPSHTDTLLDLSQEIAATTLETERYRDALLSTGHHMGEINSHVLTQFQADIARLLTDKQAIASWLGKYATTANQPAPFDELDYVLLAEKNLPAIQLSPYLRCAFIKKSVNPTHCQLFVDGETYSCTTNLAQILSSYRDFDYSSLELEEQTIVDTLMAQRYIVLA